MGKAEFVQQVAELGYKVEDFGNDRVWFIYKVPVGKFKGQDIKLGFQVPLDFPVTPPSGPHISPRLLPLNSAVPKHPERAAESSFGDQWEYWSRPFQEWPKTNRTAKDYMRYMRHLFETQ